MREQRETERIKEKYFREGVVIEEFLNRKRYNRGK